MFKCGREFSPWLNLQTRVKPPLTPWPQPHERDLDTEDPNELHHDSCPTETVRSLVLFTAAKFGWFVKHQEITITLRFCVPYFLLLKSNNQFFSFLDLQKDLFPEIGIRAVYQIFPILQLQARGQMEFHGPLVFAKAMWTAVASELSLEIKGWDI